MKKNKFKKEEKARLYLEKLEERLRYYRQVVVDSSDAVVIQDFKGIIKEWNKGAEKIYGFSEKEMLGKNIIKIIAKKDRIDARKNILSIKHGKPTFRVRQTRITKYGEKVFVIITYSPIYEKEELIEVVITEEDVSELKESLEEMKKSEARYRTFIETSPDCIKFFDLKGNLLFINRGGLKEHKIKSLKEALKIGWKAIESIAPKDRAKFTNAIRDAKNGKISVIEIEHTKDRSIREACEETITPIRDFQNKIIGILGVSRDISEKKRAEEELERQQEAILNAVEDIEKEKEKAERYLRIAGNIILILNSRGEITMINAKGNEILGYKNGELVGKNWFNTCLPKENIGEVRDVFNKLMAGDIESVETHENNIIRKDGEKRMIEWYNSLLKDDRENITGILSSGIDITERVEIDRAKTEFVSLASHQLRTPLTAIGWCAEMLKDGKFGALNEGQKEYIEKIYKSNARMTTLINALLNVSRLELGTFIIEPARADIAKIAKSVVGEIAPDIKGKKIKFNMNFGKKLPKKIKLDINLTRIIIQNLLTNAVKYTPKGGSVFLKINKNKKDFIISVRDNGYGIPKSAQDKIFTKLFRADNIKQRETDGTGLGLYMVKSIIDHIGGKVWFKSRENKGSAFFASIPLSGFKKKEGTKTLENINN